MEGRTILIGDHTGVIKVLTPAISSLGSPAANQGIVNIIPVDSKFLAIRSHGQVDEFDLEGTFTPLLPRSRKIIDGAELNSKPLLAYPDGLFTCCSSSYQTSLTYCRGISKSEDAIAFCGGSNAELWDLFSMKSKWKAWTTTPKEKVDDNKCVVLGNEIYIATSKNEVKLFDVRAGKKPRVTKQICVEGSTHFSPLSAIFVSDNAVYVGDSIGNIYKLTKELKILCKTKTRSVGEIKSIQAKDFELFSCGLDRRLMIHDDESLKILHKQYLWQLLTKVLVI